MINFNENVGQKNQCLKRQYSVMIKLKMNLFGYPIVSFMLNSKSKMCEKEICDLPKL